ncbi:LCP family protein [Solicola gregarius]|uniref:LCP family protein n=1 Tax=Solicola gregarius TaxID=2908642 RepID=A0AA46TJM3_9ACTN|nr:LCP family protein [Solicola gregarius]UYM06526.1 LCP family protein [Solicola gregarius]
MSELDAATEGDAGPAEGEESAEPKSRHRLRKALIGLGACAALLIVVVFGAGLYLQHKLTSQIDRIPNAFAGLTDRPAKSGDAVNILVMGSDRRSEKQTTGGDAAAESWIPGEQRSDTLMVLHVDGDRDGASIVSIPRDSYVDVPGHGKDKINAAFSYGGPALAVETVENLTDVRIDHIALIDWEGFERLTDALGGVVVTVPETVKDTKNDRTWTKGPHDLNGEEALLYVRQRYGLPGGDFDRINRQQAFLRSLMGETLSGDTLSSPTTLYDVLDAVTDNLSVDEEWEVGDLRGLAWSLRGIRTEDVDFTTVPIKGTGMVGAASVVFLDKPAGEQMWAAMRDDDFDAWMAEHPEVELPAKVR